MNRISGDLVLRKALRSQLRMSSASTEDLPSHVSINNTSVTSQSALRSIISVATSMDQQSVAVDIRLVDK